jgi:Mg-chelatase subunit ChlD
MKQLRTSNGIAALIVLFGAAAVAAQTVYRSRADVVVIDVAVMDGKRPMTALTKADFELRDNNVVQEVLDFDHGKLPLDVTLTIDISGSMTPAKRAAVERAVAQVSGALTPDDRGSVVTFGRAVVETTPLRHPPIAANLGGTGGGTSVWDALLLSLVTAPVPDRRQLTIFMTDGDDTSSVFDEDTVAETANHTNSQMSFVVIRGGGTNADAPVRRAFRDIARATGGEVIEIDQDEQLSQAFLAAIENFRTSYVLRYTPKGVNTPGWHDVTVRVKSKNYTIRARRGYVAR